MSAPYDPREVANYILELARSGSEPVSQMKMYKIVFFCHGWYLATYDKPLISEEFEAWEFGPVSRILRDQFKSWGENNINQPAEKLILETGELIPYPVNLLESDKNFISAIFRSYSHLSAFDLSDMTHEKGSPWHKIWLAGDSKSSFRLRIADNDIKNHFLRVGRARADNVGAGRG